MFFGYRLMRYVIVVFVCFDVLIVVKMLFLLLDMSVVYVYCCLGIVICDVVC